MGLSHAASLGVSRELALGNTAAAPAPRDQALACAAAVMAAVAVVYVTVPRLVLAPFFDTGDASATDIATHLLLRRRRPAVFDCTQNIGVRPAARPGRHQGRLPGHARRVLADRPAGRRAPRPGRRPGHPRRLARPAHRPGRHRGAPPAALPPRVDALEPTAAPAAA
ncbi:hypothetical protein LT493_17815 [Streptomyces tricolor]|nr:hypothetical protein [Streptomyces tricolor]